MITTAVFLQICLHPYGDRTAPCCMRNRLVASTGDHKSVAASNCRCCVARCWTAGLDDGVYAHYLRRLGSTEIIISSTSFERQQLEWGSLIINFNREQFYSHREMPGETAGATLCLSMRNAIETVFWVDVVRCIPRFRVQQITSYTINDAGRSGWGGGERGACVHFGMFSSTTQPCECKIFEIRTFDNF